MAAKRRRAVRAVAHPVHDQEPPVHGTQLGSMLFSYAWTQQEAWTPATRMQEHGEPCM